MRKRLLWNRQWGKWHWIGSGGGKPMQEYLYCQRREKAGSLAALSGSHANGVVVESAPLFKVCNIERLKTSLKMNFVSHNFCSFIWYAGSKGQNSNRAHLNEICYSFLATCLSLSFSAIRVATTGLRRLSLSEYKCINYLLINKNWHLCFKLHQWFIAAS